MRRFLVPGVAALAGLLLLLPLAGCRKKAEEVTLNLFIWEEYIDPEVLTQFTAETGIRIVESNYGSNEDMLAKLQATGGRGYDIVVPSDYAVQLMVRQGLLAEIDKAKVPNLKHLGARFVDPAYDPGLKHSVPYLIGTTGIGYRGDLVATAPTSWGALFEPASLATVRGRVSMLDDSREALGCALIFLGFSPNSTNEAEILAAGAVLAAQRPFLAKYDSESFEDSLAAGETVMAQGWSGETTMAASENENVRFVLPKEGALLFVDNLAILKSSTQQEAAHQLIDFLCRPDIAARISNFVMYATPNEAALPMVDEALRNGAAYQMPPPEKTHLLLDVGETALEIYERVWTQLKGM